VIQDFTKIILSDIGKFIIAPSKFLTNKDLVEGDQCQIANKTSGILELE
jgi:hypothetical protein